MSKIRKLRGLKVLRPFFMLRDGIMKKTGLFELKKRFKYHLFLKKLEREDAKKKRIIDHEIHGLSGPVLGQGTSEIAFVVSLTSYGKRVESSLPYSLYSLLTQTVLPYKIAVFLDRDNWNDENLPNLLQNLKVAGVDFYYCEDLRSYKKLIPALKQFPDNPIITVDDDFYYNSRFIEWMTDAYQRSDRKTILGQWGCIPGKKDGKFLPYSQWKDCKFGDDESPISFIGCGGICYPPHIFDDEVLNCEVFMRLCPKADDIWFWVMEERLGIKRDYIPQKGYGYHTSVDRIFDYNVGADNCLTLSNVLHGENDIQLKMVLDYYGLDKNR